MVTVLVIAGLGATVFVTVELLTRDLRLRWQLGRLPITPATDLVEGRLVKLVGTVEVKEPLIAPSSQRPCAYYHAWYDETVDTFVNGARMEKWSAVGEEEDVVEFVVRDAAGAVVVRPREGDDFPLVLMPVGAWVAQPGATPGTRTREAVLAAGEQVSVVGRVARVAAATGAALYRDAPTELAIVSPGAEPMQIVVHRQSASTGGSSSSA